MTSPPTSSPIVPENTPKNPYNTRRKSLYFSPATHSASVAQGANIPVHTLKHAAQHPEQNPQSPKRVKRQVHVDGSLTPPPSPPTNITPVLQPAVADINPLVYDEEDDPVINAIIHILQLSENTPLSTRELSSSILQSRLCALDSPNPSSVVSSRITQHLKRRAAEKPPREPLLTRSESDTGRKRTEFYLKYPDRVTDRSPLYAHIKLEQPEEKALRTTPASKLNILSSDILDMLDSDEYDSEDMSNRSPDRPTLFDPPDGAVLSPDVVFDILGGQDIMDIDVPTGIKLDYEFFEGIPSIPVDNLTPPSDDTSYPTTPLREVFSRRTSPVDPSDISSPVPSTEDLDDPQSPHSGAPSGPNTLPTSFYDSPLIYSLPMARMHTEEIEMFESAIDDDEDDEVRVVEMRTERHVKRTFWINESEDFTWEKRDGVPSPEKVGMDELEEWLEGI